MLWCYSNQCRKIPNKLRIFTTGNKHSVFWSKRPSHSFWRSGVSVLKFPSTFSDLIFYSHFCTLLWLCFMEGWQCTGSRTPAQKKVSNAAWQCRSFENWGWASDEVQHLDVFNVKLCIFQKGLICKKKIPLPGKTVLFFTSLLWKRNRRCHVSLRSRECWLWVVLFALQLDSPEPEFDISCFLWTGWFWWLARVDKSLCWFRGAIWPMRKEKHNGGSSWQRLQIPQNLQQPTQHRDVSNDGIGE